MKRTGITIIAAVCCGAVLHAISVGCHRSLLGRDASESPRPTTQPAEQLAGAQRLPKGGAQMWVENCMRCHNLRQPRERSDREWETIGLHMRIRANLTAVEHRQIVKFLKSAN